MNVSALRGLVRIANRRGWGPLDQSARAKALDIACRLAEDGRKLALYVQPIEEALAFATVIAEERRRDRRAGDSELPPAPSASAGPLSLPPPPHLEPTRSPTVVTATDVESAWQERRERTAGAERHLREMVVADEVLLETKGRRIGVINGLSVLAKDRLHLFASVAGALASFGMNILKAEAFANQQGTILDTFVFADPSRTLELNPSEVDRLQSILERVLLGRLHVKELLRSRPKPAAPSKRSVITPKVTFDNKASESATLVELIAEDRPGLLYDVASALSNTGCNIELVLVDTEAHKAMDVFYVSHAGKKLTEEHMERLKAALLAVCTA